MTSTYYLILLISTFFHFQGGDKVSKYIHDECDSLLESGPFRALSVGVIKGDKIYKIHKGKLINGESPNTHTLYEIASLTKTFTGAILAKAISDGKISLDDDIRKLLPEPFPNLEFAGHPITFRDLVTHTSGLPHMFPDQPALFENPDWDRLPFKINKVQKGFTKKQFLKELHEVKLDTVPGGEFSYSNVGANLIAYCLELIYRKSYQSLIETYILDPLEMNHTFVGISMSNSPLIARGLNTNGVEMPTTVEKELNAEGGIISNLDDMVKYMQFELDTIHPLVQICHQELLNGKYGNFENGLFWQIFKNESKPTKIFQNGGAYGTSSWLTIVPKTQTGVFIITNVSGPEIHQNLNSVVDRIISFLDEK